MIDISTSKVFAMLAGSSVALLAMLPPGNYHSTERDTRAEITKVIEVFMKAGDARNRDELHTVLHDHFRVVANQLMGSSIVNVITKDQYLALIADGKLGGDTRTLSIQSLEIIGRNASAKVKITGKQLTFESFYHLIQTESGQWQLIQDLPFATKN